MTNNFRSLQTKMAEAQRYYADSVQGSDEDFSIQEFVAWVLVEMAEEFDYDYIRSAMEMSEEMRDEDDRIDP